MRKFAEDKKTSGKYGNNFTWMYKNDTLTISGTGKMKNYALSSRLADRPRYKIKNVIIGNSVTSIGNMTFGYYSYYYSASDAEPEWQQDVKRDGFIITGVRVGAAEKYANDNGFEFQRLSN